jgi:hypothetical protein
VALGQLTTLQGEVTRRAARFLGFAIAVLLGFAFSAGELRAQAADCAGCIWEEERAYCDYSGGPFGTCAQSHEDWCDFGELCDPVEVPDARSVLPDGTMLATISVVVDDQSGESAVLLERGCNNTVVRRHYSARAEAEIKSRTRVLTL